MEMIERDGRASWSEALGADGGHASELEAARVAMYGTTWERVSLGLASLRRLLRDPDDTVQVFLAGLALNAPFFPQLLARIEADEGGRRLMAEQPSIDTRTVDFDALRGLPASTMGGAYARYLDDNGLDPDLFKPPPGLPAVPRFIAQRMRQTHDLWHVLTGYRPDVAGELALQGFTFAQLRMPTSLLISTLGTALRAPREARRVLDGYRRGRDAAFLPVIRFEEMWERPLDDVRRELRVRPASC
jgi:ubiquinone biosynthesis protein COQ4